MEVHIADVKGLPEGSFIAIGHHGQRVMRQGDLSKPCRFSENVDQAGVLKVEILNIAGSARVVRLPGPHEYELSVPCPAGAVQMNLVVTGTGSPSPVNGKSNGNNNTKVEQQVHECQRYLEMHNLTDYLQAMVKGLLEVRPDDPFAWMAAQLQSVKVERIVIVRRPPPCKGGACVVTGPSGVGKSTLIKRLMAKYEGRFGFSVSHTTRGPRPGEVDGVDYHFVTRESMEQEIGQGLFIEHAEVHGNLYGTSLAAVESVIQQGKVCLLDIDVQGADSVRQSRLAGCTTFVFFAPPTWSVLEQRLRGRGTETEEAIQKRLANARREMDIYEANTDAWDVTLQWYNEQVELAAVEFQNYLVQQLPPIPIAQVRRLPAFTGGACIVTGPSGVGKSTLIKRLMQAFPGRFGFSVSHTTRAPRPNEVDGVDYHFTSRGQMLFQMATGQFIEYAEVHGQLYGTSYSTVESVMAQGKICLLDIDIQGAQRVRASKLAQWTTFVFLAPPNFEVLEHRLRGRGTETEERVQKRLAGAKTEMAAYEADPNAWDVTLTWFDEEVENAAKELQRYMANQLPEGDQPISEIRRLPTSRGGACVVTGPSGVGKSTLIKKLLAEFPEKFGFSVSHTTREPRPGEAEGVDYHFIPRDQMERDIAAGLFIEHAEVHGNYYGTSFEAVEFVTRSGKVCLLDIDVQGAAAVRQSKLGATTTFVFFAPPTWAVLEQRLRGRGTETEERVQRRLGGARKEMDIYEAHPELWDLTLRWFNEQVEDAYAEFRKYLLHQMTESPSAGEINTLAKGASMYLETSSVPVEKVHLQLNIGVDSGLFH